MWPGKVEQAIALFQQECPKRAQKFLAYIEKHRHRLPNYKLLQTECQISIGEGSSGEVSSPACEPRSGSVESAIKQLDRRSENFRGAMES